MEYTKIDVEQGSQEWLNLRKKMITATDTASILGVAYKKTAFQLWEEKLGYRDPESENSLMRKGKILEEEARNFINESGDEDFVPVVIKSNKYPFMMASLDGMNSLGQIMEIKCGNTAYMNVESGNIEPYYYSQCQKQMFVSGRNEIHYFVYLNPDKHRGITIYRNDDFIKKMIEAEIKFHECLISKIPPELTDRDYEIRSDKEWRMYAEIYRETKFKLKELEQKEDDLKKKLIELSEGKASKGYGVSLRKIIKKGNIEYANIEVLKNIDLEQYRRKSSEYWCLRDE